MRGGTKGLSDEGEATPDRVVGQEITKIARSLLSSL